MVFAALGASGMGKEEGPVTKRRCREVLLMKAPHVRMRYFVASVVWMNR